MNASTLILAILNFEEASGYEIRKMSLEGAYAYFVDISYGSIYPTLAKLEKEGLVCSREEKTEGKPDRKIYSITEKGREEFIAALVEPPRRDKMKSEFLLLARSAEYASPAAIENALNNRTAFLKNEQKMLVEHVEARRKNGSSNELNDKAMQWVAKYGFTMLQADLDFLQANREVLIEIAGSKNPIKEIAAE